MKGKEGGAMDVACPSCGTRVTVSADTDRARCTYCEEEIVLGARSDGPPPP